MFLISRECGHISMLIATFTSYFRNCVLWPFFPLMPCSYWSLRALPLYFCYSIYCSFESSVCLTIAMLLTPSLIFQFLFYVLNFVIIDALRLLAILYSLWSVTSGKKVFNLSHSTFVLNSTLSYYLWYSYCFSLFAFACVCICPTYYPFNF